jgi:hypothetical protein
MKILGLSLIGLIATSFIVFVLQYAGLLNYQFFAPKYEAVRREVWENTPSYYAGTRRDFDSLILQYKLAKTAEEKAAIVAILRHRAAGAPPELVTFEVQQLTK